MTSLTSLCALRAAVRDCYLAPEAAMAETLLTAAAGTAEARKRAQDNAADFVRMARAGAERSGLIDKFLQEYGLSTREGVTLMRLAEALLRTPDAATADALIEDKIEAGDWAAHKGKSPFPLVNVSTRALMLTAAWLDDIEPRAPLGRMAAATKDMLDRLGEPVIRASVGQAMRIMGEHFVLGETIDGAMKRGARYAAKGYLFSFDMLGEAARTEADAEVYFRAYESAIAAIALHAVKDRTADNPGISVKLSALHPRYEYGKKDEVLKELGARTRALALKAKTANMGFNIDAEEADRLDPSLDIIESLMRDPALSDWPGFGVVVQAYQRRALPVLDWLAALSRETGRRIMVRLVKGAYWDAEIKRAQVMGLSSYPVYTRKVLTDLSFLACARRLFANADAFYPQFATHNAMTAATVQEMAGGYSDYELQRLHGMGEPLHDSLIEKGARSRIYAPVGGHKELLPYLVRRLLENGANSSFVNQLIDPDLSVDDVVADPVAEVRALDDGYANPAIPAPRDHLNGERLSARGWDETHPPTAAGMQPSVRAQTPSVSAGPVVNGETLSGDGADVLNPARRDDKVGSVATASRDHLETACAAAAAFAPQWAGAGKAERGRILRQAADMLEQRGERFMALAVFEAGKSWPDAIAEVREAIDFLRYYADRGDGLEGAPLGVVACISPWNFPLAIFLGQVSASLAAGNCVIAKPAEQTPLIAFEAVKLLHEAGVPGGALHFLPGDGPAVGAPLAAHPSVDGVVFTGSTGTAKAIRKTLVESGRHDAPLIAETGGINAMIVDSTALLEQAVGDVIASAFQSAGQRCSACRVVCVQEDVADRFIDMLAGAMATLEVGDPSSLSTDVGPVIDDDAREIIERHLKRLGSEATLIARAPQTESCVNGTFTAPAAFEIPSLDALKTEIFGPVLHVLRYKGKDLDALVDRINALGYGLTMGLHTRIDDVMHAVARRARVGNLYVNRNQIGAVVGVQPFGGEGLSGTGPKAGGPHYLSALVKGPQADENAGAPPLDNLPVEFGADALRADEAEALAAAEAAYGDWAATDRAEILKAALDASPEAGGDIAAKAVRWAHDLQANEELPGPTGEANTLKLRGRGVVLCLGAGAEGDEKALLTQIALGLAAGNCVLSAGEPVKGLADRLEGLGAPRGVYRALGAAATGALLRDSRVRAVVCDGAGARKALEKALCGRDGALAPVLSSRDAPWRFAVERTLTINTTAAGGDVRLLSLSE